MKKTLTTIGYFLLLSVSFAYAGITAMGEQAMNAITVGITNPESISIEQGITASRQASITSDTVENQTRSMADNGVYSGRSALTQVTTAVMQKGTENTTIKNPPAPNPLERRYNLEFMPSGQQTLFHRNHTLSSSQYIYLQGETNKLWVKSKKINNTNSTPISYDATSGKFLTTGLMTNTNLYLGATEEGYLRVGFGFGERATCNGIVNSGTYVALGGITVCKGKRGIREEKIVTADFKFDSLNRTVSKVKEDGEISWVEKWNSYFPSGRFHKVRAFTFKLSSRSIVVSNNKICVEKDKVITDNHQSSYVNASGPYGAERVYVHPVYRNYWFTAEPCIEYKWGL